MPNDRPSLRDIARHLNISHATVSMALKNNPRISLRRRDEVQRAAAELGYRPDPMLSSLVAYRQGKQEKPVVSVLAWINRWPDPKALRRCKEFDAYWRGAESGAAELGYKLEEFVVNEDMRGKRVNNIFIARGIRGILIPPHSRSLGLTWRDLGLEWDRFSVVRFGSFISDLRAHVIGNDLVGNSELAVCKIAEAGYRSVGFLTNQQFDRDTDAGSRMGYLRGIERKRELRRIDPLILPFALQGPNRSVETACVVKDWIETNNLDAIFTSENALAELVQDIGFRVPDDLALASTSLGECNGIDSGIDQNPFEIGRVAVQALVTMINNPNVESDSRYGRRELVEGDWIEGSTLPFKKSGQQQAI